MIVFKYTASQGPGEPSKIWGLAKKFQLGSLHTPRERRAWDPFLSGGQDVVKLCREQQQFRITWELRVRCCEPVAWKKVGAEKAGLEVEVLMHLAEISGAECSCFYPIMSFHTHISVLSWQFFNQSCLKVEPYLCGLS